MQTKMRNWWIPVACASVTMLGCESNGEPIADATNAQIASSGGVAAKAASLSQSASTFVPGQAIVKLRDDVPSARRTVARDLGMARTRHLKELTEGAMLWEIVPNQGAVATEESTRQAIAALQQLSDVEYAHENALMYFFSTPNDPYYPLQWSYPAINLPSAWDVVTGNVPIAVIDSGKGDHRDLVGKWLPGYDFGEGDADPTENYPWHHGLHVAGILAANTNNFIGGAGVCQGCSLIPIKIDNSSGGIDMATVGPAITWAATHGARVINMSFGTVSGTDPCSKYALIQSAVTSANKAGVVVVAAAGNSHADVAQVTPASCTGVIAVAASDRSSALASYSNRGTRIDVTAPGGGSSMYGNGIGCPADGTTYSGTDGALSSWAIWKPGASLTSGDYCYRYLSGTSMASPHVAGVAALILSQFPSLKPAQVLGRLKASAHPIAGCGANCGAGLIDAGAAVYRSGENPCKTDGYGRCMTGGSSSCTIKGGVVLDLPCGSVGQICCAL